MTIMIFTNYVGRCMLMFFAVIFPNICYPQAYSGFSQQSINCTVLLEKKVDSVFYPHGTGFILYNYKNPAKLIVVTCEHVLRNQMIYVTVPMDTAFMRIAKLKSINTFKIGKSNWIVSDQNLRLQVKLKKDSSFVVDNSLDIGAFPIEFFAYKINDDSIKKSTTKLAIPNSGILKRDDIILGTEIFFIGFPFSIGTEQGFYSQGIYSSKISNPLVRSGSIAWKTNDSPEFLIDAFSYSGNSGSPVFTKSSLFEGNYLIGMIYGHLGEKLVDNTGKTLIEGNFGLAKCIWIDEIQKVFNRAVELK